MDIGQFRGKFPQYSDLDDKTLADKFYAKHYSDMDRSEFDAKFLGIKPVSSPVPEPAAATPYNMGQIVPAPAPTQPQGVTPTMTKGQIRDVKLPGYGDAPDTLPELVAPKKMDYDYDSAIAAGIKPGPDGHWQSRVPQTGLILKSEDHPTFYKTIQGEREVGNQMYRNIKDQRIYSFPKYQTVGPEFVPFVRPDEVTEGQAAASKIMAGRGMTPPGMPPGPGGLRGQEPAIKAEDVPQPFRVPEPERMERIWGDNSKSIGERLLGTMASAEVPVPSGQEEPPSLLGQKGPPIKQPTISAEPLTVQERVDRTIAQVNRPVMESMAGLVGMAENAMDWPVEKLTGVKMGRPYGKAAKTLVDYAAPPESLPLVGAETWKDLPAGVVGGFLPYISAGKFIPIKEGANLLEKFAHTLGTFVSVGAPHGYYQGGEKGAIDGTFHSIPMAAAFTLAGVIPTAGAKIIGTGAAFAGSAAYGGERDPYNLTKEFLIGVGVQWLGSRGELRQERMDRSIRDWKEENGVTDEEWGKVKEILSQPADPKSVSETVPTEDMTSTKGQEGITKPPPPVTPAAGAEAVKIPWDDVPQEVRWNIPSQKFWEERTAEEQRSYLKILGIGAAETTPQPEPPIREKPAPAITTLAREAQGVLPNAEGTKAISDNPQYAYMKDPELMKLYDQAHDHKIVPADLIGAQAVVDSTFGPGKWKVQIGDPVAESKKVYKRGVNKDTPAFANHKEGTITFKDPIDAEVLIHESTHLQKGHGGHKGDFYDLVSDNVKRWAEGQDRGKTPIPEVPVERKPEELKLSKGDVPKGIPTPELDRVDRLHQSPVRENTLADSTPAQAKTYFRDMRKAARLIDPTLLDQIDAAENNYVAGKGGTEALTEAIVGKLHEAASRETSRRMEEYVAQQKGGPKYSIKDGEPRLPKGWEIRPSGDWWTVHNNKGHLLSQAPDQAQAIRVALKVRDKERSAKTYKTPVDALKAESNTINFGDALSRDGGIWIDPKGKTWDSPTGNHPGDLEWLARSVGFKNLRSMARELEFREEIPNEMIQEFSDKSGLASARITDGTVFVRVTPGTTDSQLRTMRGLEKESGNPVEFDVLGPKGKVLASGTGMVELSRALGKTSDIKYSIKDREPGPVWYSQMQRHLDQALPGKGSGPDLARTVERWVSKGRFKADELNITPAMRDSVMQGQPLFKLKGTKIPLREANKSFNRDRDSIDRYLGGGFDTGGNFSGNYVHITTKGRIDSIVRDGLRMSKVNKSRWGGTAPASSNYAWAGEGREWESFVEDLDIPFDNAIAVVITNKGYKTLMDEDHILGGMGGEISPDFRDKYPREAGELNKLLKGKEWDESNKIVQDYITENNIVPNRYLADYGQGGRGFALRLESDIHPNDIKAVYQWSNKLDDWVPMWESADSELYKVGEPTPRGGPVNLETLRSQFPKSQVVDHPDGGYLMTRPNGFQVHIKEGEIEISPTALQAGYGKTKLEPGQRVAGEWRLIDGKGIATLAKGEGMRTVLHEADFHAAMAVADLTPRERRAILKEHGTEENAARAYEKWDPAKTPNTIFQKIKDFFTNLYRTMFPTAESVFGKIRSEEVWERDNNAMQAADLDQPQYKALGDGLDGMASRFFHFLNDAKAVPTFLRGAAEKYVSPEMLRTGMKDWLRWGYLPEYVARKWPEWSPFKEANDKAYDVQAHHRQEVWQRMMAYTRGLNAEERGRVDDVRRKIDNITNPKSRAYIEGKIVEGGWQELQRYKSRGTSLTDKEAQALFGVIEAYRYVKLETIKDMVEETALLGTKYGLDTVKAKEFATKVLGTEDDIGQIASSYFPEKGGMMIKALTKQRENYNFWSRERNLYVMPHTRWGPYWTHVFNKEGELLWAGSSERSRDHATTRQQLENELSGRVEDTPLLNEMGKKDRDILIEQYRKGDIDIKDSVREKIPMSLYSDVNMPGMAAIISKMKDRLSGDAWLTFLEAKQAFFAEKGWGRHKIRRKGIPGFESENLRRVDADYMEGWAGMKGKSARVKGFNDAWANTNIKDEALNKYTHDYTKYLLDNPYEYSWIRRGLYHMYLGGSMGFRVLHALHAFQTGWPVLSTVGSGSIKTLTRAISDRAQMILFDHGIGKDPLTVEERAALQVGRHSSSLQQDYSAELAAKSGSPFSKFTSNDPTSAMAKAAAVAKMIYYPTDMDRGIRESIFLASLRMQGKITSDTIQNALKHVDDSMFRYTRGERPQFARGYLGASYMAFQTWSMKYFYLIGKLAKEGEVGALSRLALAATLVGGTEAAAVGKLALKGYELATGRDGEKDTKEYLQSLFGDKSGEMASRTFWRGIPAGLMGFDLSPRMVHHLPLIGSEYSGKPWQILGAITGPFEKAAFAGKAIGEDQYMRALEIAAPTWAGNMLAARRLSKESPETMSGRPILGEDMEPVKPLGPGETIRKAMGLQPTRLSETQSRRMFIKRQEDRVNILTHKYAVKYTNALKKGDEQGMEGVVNQIVSYNERMLKKGRYADVVDPDSFESMVKTRQTPVLPAKSLRGVAGRKMQEEGVEP